MAPLESVCSHDEVRNRDERRTVTVFGPAGKLTTTNCHPHNARVIRAQRCVLTRNAKTGLLRHSAETAFYVSSASLTANRAAKAIHAR